MPKLKRMLTIKEMFEEAIKFGFDVEFFFYREPKNQNEENHNDKESQHLLMSMYFMDTKFDFNKIRTEKGRKTFYLLKEEHMQHFLDIIYESKSNN